MSAVPFELDRLGTIMEPDPHDPLEAWGVLNPASARVGSELYLFPRYVAEGNYSRIGIVRVHMREGIPVGVTRLGIVLEPEEPYELSHRTYGGVEDPRITFVEPLNCWVMAYTALSSMGPRIGLAVSDDVFHWRRLGLLQFAENCGRNFNYYGNKDGMFFPDVVLDPDGRPTLALLHRPTYLVTHPDGIVSLDLPDGITERRESIWIGYVSLQDAQQDIRNLVHVNRTRLLAKPEFAWESLKIGGGTPPVRIPQGWLTFYHGVSGTIPHDPALPKDVRYAAGVLVLDAEHPNRIRYRSPQPVLGPVDREELHGIVPNVVFPTAIDCPEPARFDVYYGQADSRIGVATTTLPEQPL